MSKFLAFVHSYPVIGATWRVARAAGAYGLGAALYYVAHHYAEIPIPMIYMPVFGFVIQGIDKFLREKHIISYP